MIESMGGIVVHVIRPDNKNNSESDNHASEQTLKGIDTIILNDQDLTHLESIVDSIHARLSQIDIPTPCLI